LTRSCGVFQFIDKVKHRTVVPAIAASAIRGDIETGRATTYKAAPVVSYVITVGGAVDEPPFKGVGDPSCGAAENPVVARRGIKVVEVAQGHVLPARHVVERAVECAAALGRRRGPYRAIERVAADIVTDPAVFVWRNRP